jgi:hypothetical protein
VREKGKGLATCNDDEAQIAVSTRMTPGTWTFALPGMSAQEVAKMPEVPQTANHSLWAFHIVPVRQVAALLLGSRWAGRDQACYPDMRGLREG